MDKMECNVDCRAQILAQTKAIEDLTETVKEIDRHIRGNGKPGLTERVRNLERNDKKQQSNAALWGDRIWKVAISVALLILASSMNGCNL